MSTENKKEEIPKTATAAPKEEEKKTEETKTN